MITLHAQHEAFVRVHRKLKKVKKRQAKYADRKAVDVEFKVGDPVWLMSHKRKSKLEPRWKSHFRILEKKGPLTFLIKNQLTGDVISTHAAYLRIAKINWVEPPPTNSRPNILPCHQRVVQMLM